MKIIFFLTALLALVGVSLSLQSTKESTHYVAAVVEFSPEVDPRSGLTGMMEFNTNIRKYEELIAKAKDRGADIIVFPEVGLEGVHHRHERNFYEVPDHRDRVCPCEQGRRWQPPISRISCAALTNQIYVVINIHEQDGRNRYNTNVVFDRNGFVVSRYRKSHLFNEPGLQVPQQKDFGVFETDFGVTFGVAICFDLLFREPASELVHTRNIRHFVYSTAWYSELPFLTAVQTQAAWAWSHNSVLLASGLNNPKSGNTGSGIYAGRMGPLEAIFTKEKATRLLVSRVPKNVETYDESSKPPADKYYETSFENFYPLRDHLHAFATELLPAGLVHEEMKLCHDQFCCHFNIKTEATPLQTETDWQPYRLFVWDGVRDFSGAATGGVQFCAVVACKDATNVRSCGMLIPESKFKKVQFTKLEIRGEFEDDNTMILANTLNQSLLPLPGDAFVLSEGGADCDGTGNGKCLNMELAKKQEDIQTFAIYSRVFGRDSAKSTHSNP